MATVYLAHDLKHERKVALEVLSPELAADVASDGRFLLLKRAGAASQTVIVHNWLREMREKTARR